MAINIQEVPRIHCFGGPKVDLNDICNKSDECKIKECMWHKERGTLPSSLGADNRTEAMGPQVR